MYQRRTGKYLLHDRAFMASYFAKTVVYRFSALDYNTMISRYDADRAYHPRNLPSVIGEISISDGSVFVWPADQWSRKALKVYWRKR